MKGVVRGPFEAGNKQWEGGWLASERGRGPIINVRVGGKGPSALLEACHPRRVNQKGPDPFEARRLLPRRCSLRGLTPGRKTGPCGSVSLLMTV